MPATAHRARTTSRRGLRRAVRRLLGVEQDLGRLRSLVAATATVAQERDNALTDRLAELEQELERARAVVAELYVA